jgi:hypothetical protein
MRVHVHGRGHKGARLANASMSELFNLAVQELFWPWNLSPARKVKPCCCIRFRVEVVGASPSDGEDWCLVCHATGTPVGHPCLPWWMYLAEIELNTESRTICGLVGIASADASYQKKKAGLCLSRRMMS